MKAFHHSPRGWASAGWAGFQRAASAVFGAGDADSLYADGTSTSGSRSSGAAHPARRSAASKGDATFDASGVLGDERVCREVCTERDLFNAAGTFYELPAENAGGFAKVRPITTHNRRIKDYASYRGLLVLSGLTDDAKAREHIIRSDDGNAALWVGAVDDLWKFGKARGVGGPWKNTTVKAGETSDPYLMTGYDNKRLVLSHTSNETVKIRVEADIAGTGVWVLYREFSVAPGQRASHSFPDAFSAYWVRVSADKPTVATAVFYYE